MNNEKFKGNPVYWKSNNGKCVITYNQWAFTGKYTLYINGNYTQSSDFLGELTKYAMETYSYNH